MKRFVVAAVAVVSVLASLNFDVEPVYASTAAMPSDFNGDGHPDLAVAAPGMRIHGHPGAGAVVVLPASAAGLSPHAKLISQSTPGVPGASENEDGFGSSVASADFNRDGYADLAVGTPHEAVGRRHYAGSVTVLYGSASGLNTARSVWIGRPGGSVEFRGWGYSLAAGDFNGDGFPDLAVGTPKDSLPGMDPGEPVGTVRILPGGTAGLRANGVRAMSIDPGDFAREIQFGDTLAAGDLDGDGITDLVVGAQGDGQGPDLQNASVSYCLGRIGGPNSCRWLAGGDDYAGVNALAAGNMSGGTLPEIVVGVPYPYREFQSPTLGRVHVLSLKVAPSITVAHQTTITQDSLGVPGTDEDSDSFGSSVALADLDDDGYADLVTGSPGENIRAGGVTTVHGASTGWRTTGNCFYSQNTRGIPGVAEEDDLFGAALTLLDQDRDGYVDLTVGAPGENNGDGAITTLKGSPGCGFTTEGSRTFGLAALGYPHQHDAYFGSVLADGQGNS